MRGIQYAAIVAAASCALTSADAQELRPTLAESIANIEERVIEWRRDLHQHPELSNREFRTAKKVADHLEALNFDAVETGVAHTGVIGTLRGGRPGPVIGLRADMDGLPVREQTGLSFASTATGEYNGNEVSVMHACGHDAHVAMLMGAAAVLAEHRDQIAGTVKFVFQPAEEGPPIGEEGGAQLMIKEGLFAGPEAPEAMFGLHVWPAETGTLGYRYGPTMAAADNLYITIEGEQTHGSSPWLGVDPIYIAAEVVTALQGIPSRHIDVTRGPAVITIGSINGGVRGNIIPDKVEMAGTIRTFDVGEREKLHAKLKSTVDAIASANGASAVVTIDPYAPVTGNDPDLLRSMMPMLEWAAGPRQVRENLLITGAEDFSHYQKHVPGLFLMLGTNKAGVPAGAAPSNHSPFFDVNEDALIVGVRALVGFASEYAMRAEEQAQ